MKTRSIKQNRALHLMFRQLADALTDAGFDIRKTLKSDFEIMWTAYSVKELLWRPVQKAVCGKKSTTEITTEEINKIFDVITKGIGEKTGVYIPFPSIEELMKEN